MNGSLVSLVSLDSSAVIIASALKFAFLVLTAHFMAANLTPTLTPTLITMMGVPQLITALIGGFIALGILMPLRKGQAQ